MICRLAKYMHLDTCFIHSRRKEFIFITLLLFTWGIDSTPPFCLGCHGFLCLLQNIVVFACNLCRFGWIILIFSKVTNTRQIIYKWMSYYLDNNEGKKIYRCSIQIHFSQIFLIQYWLNQKEMCTICIQRSEMSIKICKSVLRINLILWFHHLLSMKRLWTL